MKEPVRVLPAGDRPFGDPPSGRSPAREDRGTEIGPPGKALSSRRAAARDAPAREPRLGNARPPGAGPTSEPRALYLDADPTGGPVGTTTRPLFVPGAGARRFLRAPHRFPSVPTIPSVPGPTPPDPR